MIIGGFYLNHLYDRDNAFRAPSENSRVTADRYAKSSPNNNPHFNLDNPSILPSQT